MGFNLSKHQLQEPILMEEQEAEQEAIQNEIDVCDIERDASRAKNRLRNEILLHNLITYAALLTSSEMYEVIQYVKDMIFAKQHNFNNHLCELMFDSPGHVMELHNEIMKKYKLWCTVISLVKGYINDSYEHEFNITPMTSDRAREIYSTQVITLNGLIKRTYKRKRNSI